METNKGYLLVVEDIPDILTLLDTTLKFKGYRVATALNGQEAYELIQKEHPALVVTDILMPKMDGFSLVHRMRIDPSTRNIPVIFLSATYVAPEDKAFASASAPPASWENLSFSKNSCRSSTNYSPAPHTPSQNLSVKWISI